MKLIEEAQAILERFPQVEPLWSLVGISAIAAGDDETAFSALSQAIDLAPLKPAVHNNLGLLLRKVGMSAEARAAFEAAINLEPSYPDALTNLGNLLTSEGSYKHALDVYSTCIALNPAYGKSYYNLAKLYVLMDQTAEAIATFKLASTHLPNSAEVQNNLGVVFRKQGALNEAIASFKKALEIDPKHISAIQNLGDVLNDVGCAADALDAYALALALEPNNTRVLLTKGSLLGSQGAVKESLACFQKAVAIDPDFLEAQQQLAAALHKTGNLSEALNAYQTALDLNPASAETLNNFGNALREARDFKRAIEKYTLAVSLQPNHTLAYHNLGIAHLEEGHQGRAIIAFQSALRNAPNHVSSLRLLTELSEFKIDSDFCNRLSNLLSASSTGEQERIELHFALYRGLGRLGRTEEAFQHLKLANDCKKSQGEYSPRKIKKIFAEIKSASEIWLRKNLGDNPVFHSAPVFIVGMPRSGTTLVEQIISAHSKVTGLGELPFVSDSSHIFFNAKQDVSELASQLRQSYLKRLGPFELKTELFVDKNPMNFRYLPMLAAAFPESKFVHVFRNGAATCWSNFERYYPNPELDFCNDLVALVDYYNSYLDLMQDYSSSLGDRMYNLDYETLTKTQLPETMALLQFLGLDFEKSVLHPHLNTRGVSTASHEQVRRPVYKNSSERWRRFELHLDGALENIRDFREPRQR